MRWGQIELRFAEFQPAEEGLAPKYVFRILDPQGDDVGHISLRVGDSWHVRFAAGHIGYRIVPEHRGHGYAYQACRALAPFILTYYPSVILTTGLDNVASIRTIERLGAEFLGIVDIPPDDPAFASGDLQRRRYEWKI